MCDADVRSLEAAGLYDAHAPHASERLELLMYLLGLGATIDKLVEHRGGLPGLATVVAVRGGPAMTLAEAVERSGPFGAEGATPEARRRAP